MKNPALTGEPAAGGACRVCSTKLDDSLKCSWCGAAYGEANRCPHCRSVAGVERKGDGVRCRVCGGPRVTVNDPDIVRSGRELPVLGRAQRAKLKRAAWGVAAGVVGAFAIVSLAIAALVLTIATPGILGGLATGAATAVPLVLAALAWKRSAAHSTEAHAAIAEAWSLVASDVLRQRGEALTAQELSEVLGIEEDAADRILIDLHAKDVVRARVTDHGELVYGTRDLPARMRVDDETAVTEEAAQAEAEASVEAEQDARAKLES